MFPLDGSDRCVSRLCVVKFLPSGDPTDMKTKVYLKNEDPAQAQANHSATKNWVDIVLASSSGYLLKLEGKDVLKLNTEETWRSLKDRLRPPVGMPRTYVHRLKAPTKPLNLDLAYPEAGRETVRHPHAAFVVACELAQALQAQRKGPHL